MPYYPSLEELISLSKEKIFLEPIDQFFEESNNIEDIPNTENEPELKKLDDELSKCLFSDDNEEISTSMESEDNNNKNIKNIKKLKLSDYFVLTEDNINKVKNDVLNKYYWMIQNNNN